MIDTILFSLLTSLVITIISYMDATSEEPDVDTSKFFKLFVISFVVNMIGIFVFKNVSNPSIYAEAVEVGLMD